MVNNLEDFNMKNKTLISIKIFNNAKVKKTFHDFLTTLIFFVKNRTV